MKYEFLNIHHPEYDQSRMCLHDDLYAGGKQFMRSIRKYLRSRHSEPPEIYDERVDRAFYFGYIGSIIDFYGSALFSKQPEVNAADAISGDRVKLDGFWKLFLEDCDFNGNHFQAFWLDRFLQALIHRRSFALIDFPGAEYGIEPSSKAEEQALGLDRAFLVPVNTCEVIDWQYNDRDELDWIMIHYAHTDRPNLESNRDVVVEEWTYISHSEYRMFRAERKLTGRGARERGFRPADEIPEVISRSLDYFPVVEIKIPDGLWIMNKVADLQLEFFNKRNALSWGHYNGLFAMPVIFSDRTFKQILGESYYLQFEKDAKFMWSEPEGRVFKLAADDLDVLKNEIYRIAHQMAFSVDPSISMIHASGESKREERYLTDMVLRAYGKIVKHLQEKLLQVIANIRGDAYRFTVTGLDEFHGFDVGKLLDRAEVVSRIGIPGETFNTKFFTQIALALLDKPDEETKIRIYQELGKIFKENPILPKAVQSSMKAEENVIDLTKRKQHDSMMQDHEEIPSHENDTDRKSGDSGNGQHIPD